MLKAVIFDKDGVLVNTEVLITEAIDSLVQRFGGNRTYEAKDRLRHGGMSAKQSMPVISKEFGMKGNYDEMVDFYQKYYTDLISKKGITVCDGVYDLLDSLKKNGVKTAVGTGSGFERTKMTMADLEPYFNAVVTSDDVKSPKPAPDTFLLAAKRLEVDPSECIVIGDSINDSQGAYNAGMKFVFRAQDESIGELKNKPDLVVENLKDLSIEKMKELFK